MEFIKKEVRDSTWKIKNTMEFTMDDTINIGENHLDVERLVLVKGNAVIEDVQAMEDRFQARGSLNYQILYRTDKETGTFDTLEGRIPFVEYINADGTTQGDYIEIHASLNDLTVFVLHSRKLSVKALIGLDYQVRENKSFEAVSDITGTEQIHVLAGSVSMMGLLLQEKDRTEVTERVEIPANKPDIYQLIWKSLSVTGVQIRAADGAFLINGTLNVFLLYTTEENEMPVQYFTMQIPFEQRVEEPLANADMISGSVLSLDQYHMTVAPDEEGRDRLLEITVQFLLEKKLYGNEEMQLVRDAYSTEMELTPEWKEFSIQHLLLRNCAKTRIRETVHMPKQQEVLQVCNAEGSVSIEETERTAKGIRVEGVLSTQVTYLNKADHGAISAATFDIPFSYEIEVPGMREEVTYSIVPFLDEISAQQKGDTRMDIRAELSFEVLAFVNEKAKAVLTVKTAPADAAGKQAMPGLIGYLVCKDDTLWSIAKKCYTTVDRIKEVNALESDEIAPGDKLVILKE